ncbi:MAG: hypothetical protein JXR78_17790 [Victivallales bacterium]|nr:hypothetical protein [Victivallales bacterium]
MYAGNYGEWNSSCIGGGGYLLNTVICPANPNIVYCNSDVGGLFRSDDGGHNWRMIHGTTKPPLYNVRSIDIDPRNPDIILAAVGQQWEPKRGIYRSIDGGRNWTKVCSAQFDGNGSFRACGQVIARDPGDADKIYAASSIDGVFASYDNGKTWKSLGGIKGHGVSDLKIDAQNTSRLWLCTQPGNINHPEQKRKITLNGGLFRSDDNGLTWEKLMDDSPVEMLQAEWDSNLIYGIFKRRYPAVSSDGGKNWTPLRNGLKIAKDSDKVKPSDHTYYLALGKGPDFIVIGSGAGDFYRLERNSDTWNKLESAPHQGNWFLRRRPGKWDHFGRATSSITIDPTNPQRWFFTDWYAVYRTDDGGKNWYLFIDGIEMTVIHSLIVDPGNPERIILGMADNLPLISNDGGKSFQQCNKGTGNTKCIAIPNCNPDILYATGPKNWSWAANALRVSHDGGQNWALLPAKGLGNMESAAICTVAVSPVNPLELYVGRSGSVKAGQGGVYRSDDGGKNFTWDSDGFSGEDSYFPSSIWHSGREIAISADGRNMVAISKSKPGIYHRRNKEKWQKVSVPVPGMHYDLTSAPCQPERFYLASGNSGLYRSDDGGASWVRILAGDARSVTCDPFVPERIAVALNSQEKIFYSEDGGDSWMELDSGLPNRRGLKLCFSGNTLLAGSDGNGVFYMNLPISNKGSKK